MRAGTPLTDEDRWPWLLRLQRELEIGNPANPVVVSCSALRKSYRDLLRRAGNIRFVFLDIDREEIERCIADRAGHFMGPSMVDSQFAAFERPDDEHDVHVVNAAQDLGAIVETALAALCTELIAVGPNPLLADGAIDRVISIEELRVHLESLVATQLHGRRILLVPPDHTRLHSPAGEITAVLYELLVSKGCHVGVLPALGTHVPMSPQDVKLLSIGLFTGTGRSSESAFHHISNPALDLWATKSRYQ
jgi:carbohydrate kinase (thermoresistant glucokinase family)